MFFRFLFLVSVVSFIGIWFHRYLVYTDFYGLVKDKDGFLVYDKGYNLSISSNSSNRIEEYMRRFHNKKLLTFHFVFTFAIFPLSLICARFSISSEICALSAAYWCAANFLVEMLWEKLLHALEDRAYLVLRQEEENILLNSKDEPRFIVFSIKQKRDRHDQRLY